MSKGEDISDIIDKLLEMDLSDIDDERKEEIIYSINEIIVDLQAVISMIES